MTITSVSFRRFEIAILAHIGPFAGELIAMIVAAHLDRSMPEPDPFTILVDDHIDLDMLAAQIGQSRDLTLAWIQEANGVAKAKLGFGVLCPFQRRDKPLPRGCRIKLASSVIHILAGTEAFHYPQPKKSDALIADAATNKGLTLAKAATDARTGSHLLYRLAAAPDTAAAGLEINRFATDLHDRHGEGRVLLGAIDASLTAVRLSLVGVALAAMLHADAAAILILPFADAFSKPGSAAIDPDEYDEPTSEYQKPPHVPPDAALLIELMPHLDITIIVVISSDVKLDPSVATRFAGAVGPYQIDRGRAVEHIIALSPRRLLGPREADTVLQSVDDPIYSGEILKLAWGIANARVDRLKVALRDPEIGSLLPLVANASRSARTGVDTFSAMYNAVVTDLATSLSPVIARPTSVRVSSLEPFYAELFVSEPAPNFLFDRALTLRESGARILLAGPPGTGKTALVAELARLMGLQVKAHTASNLFARPWGKTEANIKAAIDGGKGHILFFDEAESLMASRFAAQDSNHHLTVAATGAFLAAIQEPVTDSVIIAATNQIDDIDPAIRRRFDIILTTMVVPPDREILAWRLFLPSVAPPEDWTPLTDTVPADYKKAARALHLFGTHDPQIAVQCIKKARDERAIGGIYKNNRPVGFI